MHLLLFVVAALILLRRSCGTLPLHTTRAASSVRRREGEINVFLRVQTDDEGRHVDDLFANTKADFSSVTLDSRINYPRTECDAA